MRSRNKSWIRKKYVPSVGYRWMLREVRKRGSIVLEVINVACPTFEDAVHRHESYLKYRF